MYTYTAIHVMEEAYRSVEGVGKADKRHIVEPAFSLFEYRPGNVERDRAIITHQHLDLRVPEKRVSECDDDSFEHSGGVCFTQRVYSNPAVWRLSTMTMRRMQIRKKKRRGGRCERVRHGASRTGLDQTTQ